MARFTSSNPPISSALGDRCRTSQPSPPPSGSPLGGGDGNLCDATFYPCEEGQMGAATQAMMSLVGSLQRGSGVLWPCLHRRHFQTMVTYCSWSSTWQASAPRSACRRLGQLGFLQRMSCVDVTGGSCSLMDSLRAASCDYGLTVRSSSDAARAPRGLRCPVSRLDAGTLWPPLDDDGCG